jgi:hypothetical protein
MDILVEGASDGMDEGLLDGSLDGDGPRVWFVGYMVPRTSLYAAVVNK